MSTQINVNDIVVRYQKTTAVDQVSFQLAQGEIACLLGPSGCGKTTVLRAIAGFEPLHAGTIVLGGRTISTAQQMVAPQQRNIGMVFQDFALYPHLTVQQNISFGIAHLPKHVKQQRVDELLALVNLEPFSDRYPHELSGGQQQRVALMRAIAPKPDLLLLDEPFSNLDVALRQSLVTELRSLLKRTNITTILVTHDQTEAFAMADVIGVMDVGKCLQWADAETLYQHPETAFVAKFIGQSVLLPATLLANGQLQTPLGVVEADHDVKPAGTLQVQVRPEWVKMDAESGVKGSVSEKQFLGASVLYRVSLLSGEQLLCITSAAAPQYQLYEEVGVTLQHHRLPCFSN